MQKLKVLRAVLILLMVLVPSILISIPCYATEQPTIREYLITGGDGDSAAIYGQNYEAMQFTSSATPHTVTSVVVYIKRVGSPSTINLAIRTAAAGVPNSTNDYITFDSYNGNNLGLGYAPITFYISSTSPNNALEASTQYALVMWLDNGGGSNANYVMWSLDTGGGLADAVATKSTDSGSTWVAETSATSDALFAVYGLPVLEIVSANVFENYLASNDLLFTAEVSNDVPPYSTNGSDSKATFLFQLLGIDGTTILASVPLVEYGDYPESIYLSPTSSIPITRGGAYYIQVIGTYGTPASVKYQLQSSDWKGDLVSSKFVYFDTWIKTTAQNMESTYNAGGTLITLVTGHGWMLTSAGGAYFTDSIQNIMAIRPQIFQYSETNPQFVVGTDNTVAYTEADFEAAVGTQIAGICNTFGNLFSIDGHVFMGFIIQALILVVVLIGLFAGEGAGALAIMLVAGVPLMYAGVYVHAIGIQWVLVFAALMLFLFIRQFWWKTT